jgi:hypothetical protein
MPPSTSSVWLVMYRVGGRKEDVGDHEQRQDGEHEDAGVLADDGEAGREGTESET